jgi:hypothetical protein
MVDKFDHLAYNNFNRARSNPKNAALMKTPAMIKLWEEFREAKRKWQNTRLSEYATPDMSNSELNELRELVHELIPLIKKHFPPMLTDPEDMKSNKLRQLRFKMDDTLLFDDIEIKLISKSTKGNY